MNQLEQAWGPTPMSKKASGYQISISRVAPSASVLTFMIMTQDSFLSDREMHFIYERTLLKNMKQYLVRLRKFQQGNVDFEFPELFSVGVGAGGKLVISCATYANVKDKSKLLEEGYDDLSSYLEAVAQGIGVKVSFD